MEFVHHEDLSFIMENKGNLSEGIFVNREFSPEIERKCCTMLPILRPARHIDNYKKQIRLEKDKIVIKGKNYDMSNIHDLPDDLNAFKVTSKEDDQVVGYFGELNPLSNFFPAKFTIDGHSFISSEQYIQASKAKYFGDLEVYSQIMGCKHSVDCKDFSRKIKGVDNVKWENVAADLCRPGIREKFVQNPILLDILVKCTGTKRIVECSKDRLWGTGIPLAQVDCLDSDCWITPGIMGKILEDIRMEFCNQLNLNHHPLLGVPSYSPAPSGTTPSQLSQNHSNSGPSALPTSTQAAQFNLVAQTSNNPTNPIIGTAGEDYPSGLRQSMFLHLSSEVRTQSLSDVRSISSEQLEVASMAVDHPESANNYVSEKTSTALADSPKVST